jgi:hypothetical protein
VYIVTRTGTPRRLVGLTNAELTAYPLRRSASLRGPVALAQDSAQASAADEIERLLQLRFTDPNDPGLAVRRRRLGVLFGSLSPREAEIHYDRLKEKRGGTLKRSDVLRQRFRRLSTPTRSALLGVLSGRILPARRLYEQALVEALSKLQGVSFGRAETRHDQTFWTRHEEVVRDRSGNPVLRPDGRPVKRGWLRLKAGKKPADAIDALVAGLNRWHLDCAQFVQVMQLVAQRRALSREGFNAKMSAEPFELRPQWSTGVETRMAYARDNPGSPMYRIDAPGHKERARRSDSQLIADAPNGSRVAWTTLVLPETHPLQHVNTVKLGADAFAVHGFAKKLFGRKELEDAIVAEIMRDCAELERGGGLKCRLPWDSADRVRRATFLSRVEHYRLP